MADSDSTIRIVSAVVEGMETPSVGAELAKRIHEQLSGRRADLLIAFSSAHFDEEIDRIVAELYERLAPRAFIGASAEAVIAGDRELENRPAVVVWAASLPESRITSFHVSQADVDRFESPEDWVDLVAIDPDDEPSLLLIGDPFSVNVLAVVDGLEAAYPGRPAVGGMASAGEAPRQNVIIFDGQPLRHGMAGVAIAGGVQIDTVVSQGCRPIGRHLVITKAEQNVIYQLGGKPPMNMVTEMLRACSARDIELARTRGLLVGRVINEHQGSFARGDFLIRNPLGFDSSTGAMAVSDLVRTGQTIQFHVRDERSAAEELATMLSAAPCERAAGALLFSCNGRGTRLFSARDHDARTLSTACHGAPTAGFFCAGEIGPVSGRNYLHGHTASIALFRQPAGRPHA